jgi:hypothetical protein
MTPKQKKTLRIAILRSVFHPANDFIELMHGISDGDWNECMDLITETLTARLEMLQQAETARIRAEKRKLAI